MIVVPSFFVGAAAAVKTGKVMAAKARDEKVVKVQLRHRQYQQQKYQWQNWL